MATSLLFSMQDIIQEIVTGSAATSSTTSTIPGGPGGSISTEALADNKAAKSYRCRITGMSVTKGVAVTFFSKGVGSTQKMQLRRMCHLH